MCRGELKVKVGYVQIDGSKNEATVKALATFNQPHRMNAAMSLPNHFVHSF
jgi:hypothetical protein